MNNAEYTEEMEDWFINRTWHHINAVQDYCYKIEKYKPELFSGLLKNAEGDEDPPHDWDKFENDIIRIPYIFITWVYRCRQKGITYEPPYEMRKLMNEATARHIKNNKHHPEYWSPATTNLVNPDARDEASQVIDATTMPIIAIGEMVADWFATAPERNNDVKFWADKNVNKRWMFNEEQTKLIYEIIKNIKQ